MPFGGFLLLNHVSNVVRRAAAVAFILGLVLAFAPPAAADGRCFSDPPNDANSPLDLVEVCHANAGSQITYVVRMREGFGTDVEGLVEIAMNLTGDTTSYEAFVEVGIRGGEARAVVISQLAQLSGVGGVTSEPASQRTAPSSESSRQAAAEPTARPASTTNRADVEAAPQQTAAEIAPQEVTPPEVAPQETVEDVPLAPAEVTSPATPEATDPPAPSGEPKAIEPAPSMWAADPSLFSPDGGWLPGRLTPERLQMLQDGLSQQFAAPTAAAVAEPEVTDADAAPSTPQPEVSTPEPVTQRTAAAPPRQEPQAAPVSGGERAETRAAPSRPAPLGQTLPIVPGTDANATLDLASGTIEVKFTYTPLEAYGLGNTYGYQVRANDTKVQDNAPDQGTIPHELTATGSVPAPGQAEPPPANSPTDNITETSSTTGGGADGAVADGASSGDAIPRAGASIELLFRLGLLFVLAGGGLVAYETVTRVRWQTAGPTFELSVAGAGFAPAPLTAPVLEIIERAAASVDAVRTRLASEESLLLVASSEGAVVAEAAAAEVVAAGHVHEPVTIAWTIEMGAPTTWAWAVPDDTTRTTAGHSPRHDDLPKSAAIILASPTRAPPPVLGGRCADALVTARGTASRRVRPPNRPREGFRPLATPDARDPNPSHPHRTFPASAPIGTVPCVCCTNEKEHPPWLLRESTSVIE